ncbi:MAG: hypothetical protein EOP45_03600 [Sphingobacteriaceae bacterium]|nr:MAG: hypothetical protein EOP45_03600 [Sphingobacteriaceae bacterium]
MIIFLSMVLADEFYISVLCQALSDMCNAKNPTTNDSNLFGKYILNEKSNLFLKDMGLNPVTCTLKLNKDKSFVLENAPSGITDYNTQNTPFSKTGDWSVNCDKSYGCLIELQGIAVVPLSEKDGRIAIPIVIGDGDECNGIVFVRK